MGSTTTYCEREPLLPQTTTGTRRGRTRAVLYPTNFYIKTTTTVVCSPGIGICILSISTSNHYGLVVSCVVRSVVSYQISTSNHNLGSIKYRIPVIYSGIPLKKSFPSCRRRSLNVVFFQTQTDKCIKKIPIGEAFRVWRVRFYPSNSRSRHTARPSRSEYSYILRAASTCAPG